MSTDHALSRLVRALTELSTEHVKNFSIYKSVVCAKHDYCTSGNSSH